MCLFFSSNSVVIPARDTVCGITQYQPHCAEEVHKFVTQGVVFMCVSEWTLLCRPGILKDDMKVFFVKYNDPIYVKLEKLDIMIRLTNEHNIAQVLSELKE